MSDNPQSKIPPFLRFQLISETLAIAIFIIVFKPKLMELSVWDIEITIEALEGPATPEIAVHLFYLACIVILLLVSSSIIHHFKGD